MDKYQVFFYSVGDDRVVCSLRQTEEVMACSKFDAEKAILETHKNIWISEIIKTINEEEK